MGTTQPSRAGHRPHPLCVIPQERETSLVPALGAPFEAGKEMQNQPQGGKKKKKTGKRNSCASPAQTKPLQEVFPWIGIAAACQSHLMALTQQVQAGEGAGLQLLGVSPLCPDDPCSQSPLGYGTPYSGCFRHSPASIRASQRSQGGDLWLTTAPACGQGVGSPQSPKSWIPARPINKYNSKASLQAGRADKVCPACMRDSVHITAGFPFKVSPKTRGHPFSLPTGSY